MYYTYSSSFSQQTKDGGEQKDLNENRLMTIQDLCEYLSCRTSYVYRLVHERRIPYIKLGHRKLRFDPKQINEWLAKYSVGPSDTF